MRMTRHCAKDVIHIYVYNKKSVVYLNTISTAVLCNLHMFLFEGKKSIGYFVIKLRVLNNFFIFFLIQIVFVHKQLLVRQKSQFRNKIQQIQMIASVSGRLRGNELLSFMYSTELLDMTQTYVS